LSSTQYIHIICNFLRKKTYHMHAQMTRVQVATPCCISPILLSTTLDGIIRPTGENTLFCVTNGCVCGEEGLGQRFERG
jgi:hypothetical protein